MTADQLQNRPTAVVHTLYLSPRIRMIRSVLTYGVLLFGLGGLLAYLFNTDQPDVALLCYIMAIVLAAWLFWLCLLSVFVQQIDWDEKGIQFKDGFRPHRSLNWGEISGGVETRSAANTAAVFELRDAHGKRLFSLSSACKGYDELRAYCEKRLGQRFVPLKPTPRTLYRQIEMTETSIVVKVIVMFVMLVMVVLIVNKLSSELVEGLLALALVSFVFFVCAKSLLLNPYLTEVTVERLRRDSVLRRLSVPIHSIVRLEKVHQSNLAFPIEYCLHVHGSAKPVLLPLLTKDDRAVLEALLEAIEARCEESAIDLTSIVSEKVLRPSMCVLKSPSLEQVSERFRSRSPGDET